MAQIDLMTEYNNKSLQESTDQLSAEVRHGLSSVIWGNCISIAVGIALGFLITRSLAKVLSSVTHKLAYWGGTRFILFIAGFIGEPISCSGCE